MDRSGELVPPVTADYFDDRNPLGRNWLAVRPRCSWQQVRRRARRGRGSRASLCQLQSTLAKERERILGQAAALLEERRDEFLSVLVDEIGSPIREAQFELSLAVSLMRASRPPGMAPTKMGRENTAIGGNARAA